MSNSNLVYMSKWSYLVLISFVCFEIKSYKLVFYLRIKNDENSNQEDPLWVEQRLAGCDATC
jgi:hypothetical protein